MQKYSNREAERLRNSKLCRWKLSGATLPVTALVLKLVVGGDNWENII
jgi:hypothetical protein